MASSVNNAAAASRASEYSNESNGGSVATVQVGEDNLSQVAQRLGINLESLLRANPQIADPNKIQAGQDIHLPQPAGPQTTQDSPAASNSASESGLPPAPMTDPLARSMVQATLDTKAERALDRQAGGTLGNAAPAAGPVATAVRDILNGARSNVVYADSGGGSGSIAPPKTTGSSGPVSTPQACTTESPDVKTALTHPQKDSTTKDDFAAAQKAIEAGDYTKAFQTLDRLIRTGPGGVPSNVDLPDDEQKLAQTMRDQLEFLSKMQQAGIKACYPPTESELVDYFKKLKDKPAAARQAFQDYAERFQVHPVNIKGADFEVKYSKEIHSVTKGNDTFDITTDVPRNWSDVASRPVSSKDFPQFIGKQMNDCKGYAFMAEKLLGAAGFKVEHHLDAFPSKFGDGHMMVMFSHPGEQGFTLTSNDGVFRGNNQKELAKQGFEFAAGGKDNLTGKEHFFTGKTAADAQVQQGIFQAATKDGVKGIKFDELP